MDKLLFSCPNVLAKQSMPNQPCEDEDSTHLSGDFTSA
ncbi:hypothetical protein VS85_00517 [Vibrio cholerae]|nr:hypothetical protein VCH_002050 [Vibrio cholerae CIRS101]EEY40913.1 hypothetical protein VIJ_002617 [Vibrio cholerae RC27]KKP16422.1 hypothetical protein VS84_00127 [Vibrio cholerae]KKP18049.1 hypothetical protein VS85_00517 [Vibrio cholerae]KKP22016.1 hypothetical protein VS86_00515 [Vibrio cholerae]